MELRGQLHASAILLQGKDRRIQRVGCWGGTGSGMDAVTKRKIPFIAPAGI